MTIHVLPIAVFVVAGVAIGAVSGNTRSCEDGGCPLTATPTRGAVWGGLLGLVLALALRPAAPSTAEGISADLTQKFTDTKKSERLNYSVHFYVLDSEDNLVVKPKSRTVEELRATWDKENEDYRDGGYFGEFKEPGSYTAVIWVRGPSKKQGVFGQKIVTHLGVP